MKCYSDIALSTDDEMKNHDPFFSYESYDKNAAYKPVNELDADEEANEEE